MSKISNINWISVQTVYSYATQWCLLREDNIDSNKHLLLFDQGDILPYTDIVYK